MKSDCPTCQLVVPVLAQLEQEGAEVRVFYQDEGGFLGSLSGSVDDRDLERSFRLGVESVPTIVRFDGAKEVARAVGWSREEWEAVTGITDLGPDLEAWKPACGSRSVAPGAAEVLEARFGSPDIRARRIDLEGFQDPVEACYDRGWSDGFPVVPPTPERVLRMLAGTTRDRHEVIGLMPPDLAECTVEKVAINAVMAGCRPEYMPLVLAAMETALDPHFTLHGLTCSTCFSSPVIIVNGPISDRLGMNSGLNALGQGNRANSTIGRAVNLVVRNVGGGRPGEIDRATLGAPSKVSFCFAEDESDPEWTPLAQSRGVAPGRSAVTLFQGDGVQGVMDQGSRTPEELTRSLAASLLAVGHTKLCEWARAVLVLSPEHYGIYRDGGWGRDQITEALHAACERPGSDVVRGARGIGEGVDESRRNERVPKFHPDGLLVVRAGGPAGLYSAILAGWPGGRAKEDSFPITKEIPE
ncbi:MAG: thioredoxin family protein [Longimicrobiales bacterium]